MVDVVYTKLWMILIPESSLIGVLDYDIVLHFNKTILLVYLKCDSTYGPYQINVPVSILSPLKPNILDMKLKCYVDA